MVDSVDVFVGYRANPHLDMRERGQESAQHLRALLGGRRTVRSFIRLPIIPPTVTMLTAPTAPLRPYGEMIDLGQRRMAEAPYAGRILNVSVMGGFAYADTSKNGLSVMSAPSATQSRSRIRWPRRSRLSAGATARGFAHR